MATMTAAGFGTLENPFFVGQPSVEQEAQLAPKKHAIRAGRTWSRLVDRISSGICENAVRHHRTEHEHMASQAAAALQFRQKLAELKGRLVCKPNTPFPPVAVDA
jgi:hypothetical protein